MILWNKGVPPKENRKFVFEFSPGDVRVLMWAERQGEWRPWDGSHSYVTPRFWAEINYPDTPNGEVRGASRLAGEASSAEGATSTVVLEGERS